jgi:hypothetical protein
MQFVIILTFITFLGVIFENLLRSMEEIANL